MNSLNYVIVEVDSEYNNEEKIGDTSIIVNTTIESVAHINRIARVVSAPEYTVLKKGDDIIVHHNIFRKRNSQFHTEVKSDYHIKDKLFYVPLNEIFAYKKDSTWKALDPFVFVKPIKASKTDTSKVLTITGNKSSRYHKGCLKNVGVVEYPNKELIDNNIVKGTRVWFTDDSEYEFKIDGQILYRMKTSDILGIANEGSK